MENHTQACTMQLLHTKADKDCIRDWFLTWRRVVPQNVFNGFLRGCEKIVILLETSGMRANIKGNCEKLGEEVRRIKGEPPSLKDIARCKIFRTIVYDRAEQHTAVAALPLPRGLKRFLVFGAVHLPSSYDPRKRDSLRGRSNIDK